MHSLLLIFNRKVRCRLIWKKSGETAIKWKKNVLHHIYKAYEWLQNKSEQPVVCYIQAWPDTLGAHKCGTASVIKTINIEDHQ